MRFSPSKVCKFLTKFVLRQNRFSPSKVCKFLTKFVLRQNSVNLRLTLPRDKNSINYHNGAQIDIFISIAKLCSYNQCHPTQRSHPIPNPLIALKQENPETRPSAFGMSDPGMEPLEILEPQNSSALSNFFRG